MTHGTPVRCTPARPARPASTTYPGRPPVGMAHGRWPTGLSVCVVSYLSPRPRLAAQTSPWSHSPTASPLWRRHRRWAPGSRVRPVAGRVLPYDSLPTPGGCTQASTTSAADPAHAASAAPSDGRLTNLKHGHAAHAVRTPISRTPRGIAPARCMGTVRCAVAMRVYPQQRHTCMPPFRDPHVLLPASHNSRVHAASRRGHRVTRGFR